MKPNRSWQEEAQEHARERASQTCNEPQPNSSDWNKIVTPFEREEKPGEQGRTNKHHRK